MSEREKRRLAPFYAPEARTGAGKNGASWRGARYNSEQQVGTALELCRGVSAIGDFLKLSS